ncbi:MAG: class I SAM-dependent methyltransferase [Lentisphaeraceae bacterium]|nr:class I SAM-dependent methyltransferase [Lentisphaeraceae bacterium]
MSYNKDDLQNIEYYQNRFKKFGRSYETLNWGSKESQELRFSIFSEIGRLNNKKLLDIGCGLGDYYNFLTDNKIDCSYKGIDLVEDLVGEAKQLFPEATFEVEDLFSMEAEYDFIFASGIFYLRKEKPFEYMKAVIEKMFSLCTNGVAFNSLSTWALKTDDGEFCADPVKVLEFCKSITQNLVLKHDYHPSDFTVYMYR